MKPQPPQFSPDDRGNSETPSFRRTSREAEYLRRLAKEQTPVVVHLRTGEIFRGFVEYYDRRFIRLTRASAPNLFLFKRDIKYLYEE